MDSLYTLMDVAANSEKALLDKMRSHSLWMQLKIILRDPNNPIAPFSEEFYVPSYNSHGIELKCARIMVGKKEFVLTISRTIIWNEYKRFEITAKLEREIVKELSVYLPIVFAFDFKSEDFETWYNSKLKEAYNQLSIKEIVQLKSLMVKYPEIVVLEQRSISVIE